MDEGVKLWICMGLEVEESTTERNCACQICSLFYRVVTMMKLGL